MLQGKFHIAFATTDLKRIKAFYGGLLGCAEGRSAANWVDYNFFGHQLTIQEVPRMEKVTRVYNPASNVPSEHWGIVLDLEDWKNMRDKCRKIGVTFFIEPCTVMKGEVGEQMSFFIEDPDGHAIEFKAMAEKGNLFKKGRAFASERARLHFSASAVVPLTTDQLAIGVDQSSEQPTVLIAELPRALARTVLEQAHGDERPVLGELFPLAIGSACAERAHLADPSAAVVAEVALRVAVGVERGAELPVRVEGLRQELLCVCGLMEEDARDGQDVSELMHGEHFNGMRFHGVPLIDVPVLSGAARGERP